MMKKFCILFVPALFFTLFNSLRVNAQFPMPPAVPIWDGNKVELKLYKVAEDVYSIQPATVHTETTKGIPQATSGGFIVGEKGVMINM